MFMWNYAEIKSYNPISSNQNMKKSHNISTFDEISKVTKSDYLPPHRIAHKLMLIGLGIQPAPSASIGCKPRKK